MSGADLADLEEAGLLHCTARTFTTQSGAWRQWPIWTIVEPTRLRVDELTCSDARTGRSVVQKTCELSASPQNAE